MAMNEQEAMRAKVVLARNTTDKHKTWDKPALSQCPDNPLPDVIMFPPRGMIALTPGQMMTMGRPPRGVILEDYDEDRHGPVIYAGG